VPNELEGGPYLPQGELWAIAGAALASACTSKVGRNFSKTEACKIREAEGRVRELGERPGLSGF